MPTNHMTKSGVPWAEYRWNPIEGCSAASEGCLNCYAKTMAGRFHRPWGHPVYRPERLEAPLHTRRPGRVFVCSTSDLFHNEITRETHEAILAVMMQASSTIGHTFLLLTKRPRRMREVIGGRQNPFWLGATTENQARLEERCHDLIATPAAVHFISAEPLLGPLDISQNWLHAAPPTFSWPVDWVIAGPENGPHRRPCDPDWIKDLQLQCDARDISFFDKRPDQKRKDYPWMPA